MDLKSFFKNPFSAMNVGSDKFRKFCEIHIQRIAARNDGGKYDTMLTETTDAYTTLFGAMTDGDTKFAVQQSYTKATNSVVEEFKQKISQKEGTIRGNWNKGTSVYQEFFPLGVTEYSQATLGNVETLMNRIVTAAEAHAAELGQAFVDLFKDIRSRFITARANQLKKIGEVKGSKTAFGNAKGGLEKQLMKNLLTLAMEFMDDPETGAAFFDQSIVKSSTAKAGGNGDAVPATPQ